MHNISRLSFEGNAILSDVARFFSTVLLVLLSCGRALAQDQPGAPVATPSAFDAWVLSLKAEAVTRGIRPEVVDAAFADLQPVDSVLERDRSQAEFTLDLDKYLKRRLTRDTIRTAQGMYTKHRALLAKIGQHYGVSPRVIVAVWGLESNFGRFAGVRPTIPTLATLAYDPRRSTLFRGELLSALEIVNRGDIELEHLKGSWAGALGQPQFMPSSYLRYAQDFDEDGRRDIWSSPADVFASVAFYLHEHGWTDKESWGMEVRVSPAVKARLADVQRRDDGCRAERMMSTAQPLTHWRNLGFRTMANRPLPKSTRTASVFTAGSRTFLVYSNYDAFLAYNCAHTYALSVGLLSDRLR
jgi:peptidoglycan lytic transglycosylase B